MSQTPITRESLSNLPARLLRDGRVANAVVSCVEADGKLWTVKDFAGRPWWIRQTVAPFLLARELRALNRLRGIPGIAEEAFRIDRHALAVRFMEGTSIDKADRSLVTPVYLERLEALVAVMHARGVVHLDMRGAGNVMVRPDGTPGLIDFQASVVTERLPGFLRRLLEDFDLSGALKKWRLYQPEAMGEQRREALERINRLRKFWIFRGYFGLKKK